MDDIFEAPAMAIILSDLDALGALLAEDASWATRQSSVGHPTLLQMIACEAANIENPTGSAQLLLDAGADPYAPLVAAAGCDSRSVLDLLLDSGVDVNGQDLWTPLDEALYWCNHDIAGALRERGAAVRALSTAAGLGVVEELERFVSADGTLTPEAGPIGSPFPDTVPADLADDKAAMVNHAFVMAVNAGQQSAAQWLLERGAEVNAKPPGYHWLGTALHAACWRGDASLVKWLMANGADPTIHDGLADSDAVGWANFHDHPELVPLLQG